MSIELSAARVSAKNGVNLNHNRRIEGRVFSTASETRCSLMSHFEVAALQKPMRKGKAKVSIGFG